LGFAGPMAQLGIALCSVDAFGHGLVIAPEFKDLIDAVVRGGQDVQGIPVGALFKVLSPGRARDLNNDGIPDSGGDFWSADMFHTRDVIRQSVVDWMQLVRILRSFDGRGKMAMGNQLLLAGDFNNDGVPDLGGVETFSADIISG